MNLKKTLVSIIMIMMLVVLMGLPTTTYAATQYMGVVPFMTNGSPTEPSMGYAINNQAVIWNIVKYDSQDSTTYSTADNIYCVKAGVGFADPDTPITDLKRPYDVFYNMKTQREDIKKQNDVLRTLVEKTITEGEKTISCYDALLAVLDMLYLPGESDPEEVTKINEKVLDLAKRDDDYIQYRGLWNTAYTLTENDIEAVQQAVIWYFTNYYKMVKTEDSYSETTEHETKYDNLDKQSWLYYKLTNMTNYDRLANYTPNGQQPQYDAGQARTNQAEILYQYMIKTAKQKAAEYANASSMTGVPVVVNKKTLTSTESGDRCIVGPIHMTEQNPTPYTLTIKVNGKENNYQLVDKTEIPMGEDFYISIPKSELNNLKIDIDIQYNETTMTLMASSTKNQEQPLVEVHKEPKTETVTLTYQPEEKPFDLALRKYITKKNGTELTGTDSRVPNVDESTISTEKTASYKHQKAPVTIATNDVITYKLTIYNEGEKAGRATKVVDQLPTGLRFDKVVDTNGKGSFELDNYNETTNTLTLKRKEGNTTNLPAYTSGSLQNNGNGTETIEIECTVTEKPDQKNSKILTNVAWIAQEVDEDGNVITTEKGKDRDSEPGTTPNVNKDNMSNYKGNGNKDDLSDKDYYYKGQQDDDDFEKLVLLPENFDLALRKFVTAVNNDPVAKRIDVDVSNLNKVDQDGNIIATTADYKENKPPVSVAKGDIVTYTFRIYNEGTIDGYAQEITEDVPEGLQFLWSEKEGEELAADTTLTEEEKEAIEFNQKYLWGKFVYDENKENIIKISSDYLSKANETTVGGNLIPAFGRNDGTKTEDDLKYKEIAVKFKVVSEDTTGSIIRNEAAITDDADKDGNPVDDRDSTPEEWKEHPDHEDDEDHDYITLQSFDLALRKFIIAISKDTKIENEEYLKNEDGSYTRAPQVDTSKLNTIGEDGKLVTTATYTHTKEPVMVQPNDIVVYMLRVYNEGDVNGYAAEIKDHLPPYLEYIDSDFNKEYGWSVSEDGRTVTTSYLSADKFLINKAQTNENGKIELSYQEVPIMCKVSENPKTNENITNIADITKYLDEEKKPAKDRDSSEDNVKLPDDKDLPGYNDHQEDDDDYEKLVVKIFDLALRKWVTQAIVIENGQETVTQTGHDPWDDPEDIVKVEIHRKKTNQVTVKFRYSIRIYNQGEIAGYAKEITDYVPEGLKFVAEDNPGWTDEGNNVISTRLLENTLLQPGEYADVEVLLTWINSEDNMGVKTNKAEISEDYNEYGVPDIDSTPDNQKPGEDDIDDAPVMLSVSTGQVRIYFTLGFILLITVAGGVVLIKKFVL